MAVFIPCFKKRNTCYSQHLKAAAYHEFLSMYNRKNMLALVGVALMLVGTLYLAPVIARPYWYQSTEDGETVTVPPYAHCYVNGTWTMDENGAFQPPCWDPDTGEYAPRYNGTQPDWCPYEGSQTGQSTGGLGGMMRNWGNRIQQGWNGFRGGMMQGFTGGFRRGGGCGWTG
jgi:hypothetical protein